MNRLTAIVGGLVLAAALGAVPRAHADDDVTVRARVEPGAVEVGGQAMLIIEVEGKFRKSASPELPPLGDFDVYEAGTSQNFSFVNGQVHSSIVFNYVLTPRREGTFKIEPIRFSIGNKQYAANPVSLDVVAAGPGAIVPRGAPPATGTPRGDLPSENESIFIAASVDHDTVYVNEQVTWTLGYYTDGRVDLVRSPNYSPPTSEGFWVEDLPPQNKYYATLHGRQYLVSEIKRAYFPTAPGTYTISEARVDIVVDGFGRGSVDDFFDRGFRGGFGRPQSLTTKPIKIVVRPLPARGKPAGFQGAVAGNLSVSIAADKQAAQVGEPVNVVVEINGVGNMRTLGAPGLGGMDKFKVYESGNSTDSFKQEYVVSGRRKFNFVVVPQVEGEFTIPPVSIPYFDTATRAYRVAQSAAVPLRVNPGTNESGRKVIYAGAGDDFKVLNRDIRFIHQPPASLAAPGRAFYATPWFMVMPAVPALALGGAILVERRRRRLREDVGFARASRALRDADRRLSEAEAAFRGANVERGYAAVGAAVVGYVADKANVPAASLTSDAIESLLSARGVTTELAAGIRSIVAQCDAARYAAATVNADDGRALVRTTRETLVTVEKALA